MTLRINLSIVHLTVLAVHVPILASPENEKYEFYSLLSINVRATRSGDHIAPAGDFFARTTPHGKAHLERTEW